ncbi:MAG: HzsA-related protein [Planctomycetota bacterium]
MGAYERCRRAMLLGLVIVGLISISDVAAGQQGPAGSDSPDELLLDLLGGYEEIVFACRQEGKDGHWYANFGYYAGDGQRKAYRALGRLCKLNVRTDELTVLIDDPKGTVRDPQVHYNGRRIVFSYRKGGTDSFHLYEINTDGTGLRQLTEGPYNDIEPTYLADGGILFCSDRCNRWVNCWLTKVAVMYRCDADGSNIRQISSNSEHENTPWPLPDGRVLYQRWEYVDRSQVHYHHLWTTNPDGTGQMVFYGNMHPGIVMIDAKPIPGTDKVVAVFSPGHGRREHAGAITILSPKKGPDDLSTAQRISKKDNYRDPYPLSAKHFLVAQDASLLLMDEHGAVRTIYKLPVKLAKAQVTVHEPRPIMPRMRERMIAPRVALKETTGRLILSDVYNGRRMDGVRQGDVKKLLILETLPMPIHYTGGMDPVSFGGTFTLERILGTVPVEPDGSAYMELPALRSFFFVALDENDDTVKRMQSFLTVMPGETTSCVGCHEHRTQTPENRNIRTLAALKRKPSKVTPIPGIPDVFEFPRDIQPIFDKHCLDCHDYDNYAGEVILTGDRGPMFSHSYYTLTYRREFVDGRDNPESNLAPRSIGAAASPLMKRLDGQHYDVKLPAAEVKMIRYWIEAGAPYPGTYGALGSGMIGGYYENRQVNTDFEWETSKLAGEAIRRRCTSCHSGNRVVPLNLSDEREVSFWRPDPDDPRLRMTRHLVFNLTRPDKSLMLLAPLTKEAGGYGLCKVENEAVFANTQDPDYQKILAMCREGKKYLEEIKRFDMPGFIPPAGYVNEMKNYGILPDDLPDGAAIDVYATDRKYWQSLWYKPSPR